MNSRLDTLQAGILLPKLEAFRDYELDNRQVFANMYTEKLKNYIATPIIENNYVSSYAQYTLILDSEEQRNFLKEYLNKNGIPSMIYYPKPLHRQIVYSDYNFNLEDLTVAEDLCKKVLSIPMHPYLTEETVDEVCSSLIEALRG